MMKEGVIIAGVLSFLFAYVFIQTGASEAVSVISNTTMGMIATKTNIPVHETKDYTWAAKARRTYSVIAEEFEAYENTQDVPLFVDLDENQTQVDKGKTWQTLWLRLYDNDTNLMAHFPKTRRILSHLPCRSAMFSILNPGTELEPHHGPTNLVWRYHLGVEVPTMQGNEKLGLGIMDNNDHIDILRWGVGQDLMFDDSFLHSAINTTTKRRVVLFLDVDRQDIRPWTRPLYNFLLFLAKYNTKVLQIVRKTNAYCCRKRNTSIY